MSKTVVFAFHAILDMGGIINYSEDLGVGFQELGWNVEMVTLVDGGARPMKKGVDGKEGGKYYMGKVGLWLHPEKGHVMKHRIGYDEWEPLLEELKADMIVWIIPVPTKNVHTVGNNRWLKLYDTGIPQVAVIHDGNARHLCQWIMAISGKVQGFIGVHSTGYNSVEGFGAHRSLVPNPHDMSMDLPMDIACDWKDRENAFLHVANSKSWKHYEEMIRSVPYIPGEVTQYLAGYGREIRYMRSPTKVKPVYFCRKKFDPDLPEELERDRVTIWQRAERSGMNWLGIINPWERDEILHKVKILYDGSWSLRYSALGGIWNRTTVEGMRCGAVPCLINYGISDNEWGDNELFKPGVNYVMLPWGLTPKQRGEALGAVCMGDWEDIQQNNVNLLGVFDCKRVASQYVKVAGLDKLDVAPIPIRFARERKITAPTEIVTAAANVLKDHFKFSDEVIADFYSRT